MRPSDLEPSFISHAPGYWPPDAMDHWSDYKWQLRNRVDTLTELETHLKLTDVERAGVCSPGTSWRCPSPRTSST
jgi:lysine 2,3-aminomutase